jgi:hypothetical protein
MAIQTVVLRTAMATAYATNCPWMGLATTAPGASRGTEPTGGSPAYARKASNAGTAASSAVTFAPGAFDVPSGTTIVGVNMESASTAGTYQDGASVTSQAFASQGTYTVTATYTQA